eukprot:16512-Heterococcus_DN1.PRE.3
MSESSQCYVDPLARWSLEGTVAAANKSVCARTAAAVLVWAVISFEESEVAQARSPHRREVSLCAIGSGTSAVANQEEEWTSRQCDRRGVVVQ